MYISAQKPQKAMVAHERALAWRELFTIAVEEKMSDEDIVETAYRVAGKICITLTFPYGSFSPFYFTEELISRKRFLEAGHVLIDYAKNIRQCVSTLAQGNLFSEARRMVVVLQTCSVIDI